MKKILSLVLMFSFSFAFFDVLSSVVSIFSSNSTEYHKGESEFEKINPENVTNIYGNLQITGNTIMCVTPEDSVYHLTKKDYEQNYPSLSCTDDISKNDNSYITKYIDIDDDSSTYNSSSAYIVLPNTYKEIVWAGLFWQGHVNDYSYIYAENYEAVVSNDFSKYDKDVEDTPANEILIKINDEKYQKVIANRLDWVEDYEYIHGEKREGFEYAAYADVTDLFKDKNFKPYDKIKITIANLYTSRGLGAVHGDFGAWSLVIIYKEDMQNPLSKLRNNSVYYGYNRILNRSVDIEIKNLILPNKVGQKINTYMALFSAEGEYVYGPDYVFLNDELLDENLYHNNEDVFEKDNVFDARLSDDIQREPSLYNNNGIDIDVFNNASEIMEKMRDNNPNQKSYNVKITIQSGPDNDEYVSLDTIYPSVVIFSTELYQPRVCYYIDSIEDNEGVVVFKDGKFLKDINPNKEYKINFWIANMKKTSDDEDLASAKNVKIFLKMKDFNYTFNSTAIKNIGEDEFYDQTDIKDEDLFSFFADEKKGEYHLGEGADGDSGGEIDVAEDFDDESKKAFVSFKGKFDTEENQSKINIDKNFIFKASFATDYMSIDEKNAIEISKCIPFDANANIYIPQLGIFNVVEPSFNASKDPISPDNELNQIYTKIAEKPFNIKVLHLGSDKESLQQYKGLVEIDIIKSPKNETECNENDSFFEDFVYFDNDYEQVVNDINISEVFKDVRFRVRFTKDKIPSSCIELLKHPHRYRHRVRGSSHNNRFRGGNCHELDNETKKKRDKCIDDLKSQNTSQEVLDCIDECDKEEHTDSQGANKTNNEVGGGNGNTHRHRYRHRCKKGLTCVLECLFANSESVCSRDNFAIRPDRFEIIGNGVNKARAGKLYTYEIKALSYEGAPVYEYNEVINSTYEIIPHDIKEKEGCNTADLNIDSQSGMFNDGVANIKMAYMDVGEVNMTIREINGSEFAKVDEGESGSDLYIKPFTKTFTFIPDHFDITNIEYKNAAGTFTYLSDDLSMASKLTFNVIAKNENGDTATLFNKNCYAKNVKAVVLHKDVNNNLKLIYKYSKGNKKIKDNTKNIANIIFANSFNNGSTSEEVLINFEKDYKKPINPFELNLTKIIINDKDDNVSTSISIDKSAKFIYGRINIPNISGYAKVLHNTISFEYYENNEWKINKNHNSSDYGDIDLSKVISNGVSIALGNIDKGYETLTYTTTKSPPLNVKIHYAISPWLWYHPKAKPYANPSPANLDCLTHPCNKVEFLAVAGGWAGVGNDKSSFSPKKKTINLKSRADINASKSHAKKLNW